MPSPVGGLKLHGLPGRARRQPDLDPRPLGVLVGVRKEVVDRAAKERRIPVDHGQIRRHHGAQGPLGVGRAGGGLFEQVGDSTLCRRRGSELAGDSPSPK